MAANNEEKISSYIDLASVGKETDAFTKQLTQIYDMFKKINATKITIEQSKTFEQTAAAVRKLKTEEDELQKISSQIEATYKKRMALESEQAKILAEEKILLQQRNAELKNQVREQNAAEGSIEKLSASLFRLNKEYDNLSKAERDAGKGTDLLNNIKAVDTELKKLEGDTGRFQRNVGNYGNAFKGALTTLENELTNVKNKLNDPAMSGKQLESLRNQEQLLSEVLQGVSVNFESTRQEARAFQEAAQKIGLSLGQQSEAFQLFRSEVGKGVDDINDIKQSIKLAASDTQGFDKLIGAATALTGAFSVAQGAAALFGQDNEELQKTFVKLQAAMTILNGLQAIQNELKNKDSIFRKIALFLTTAETKIIKEQTVAEQANTVATEAGTVATKSFGAALKALTIGTVLILLPILASAFSKLADTSDYLNESFKRTKAITPEVEEALRAYGETAGEIADGVISSLNDEIKRMNDELGLTPSKIEEANGALSLLQQQARDIAKDINIWTIALGGVTNATGGQFAALQQNYEKQNQIIAARRKLINLKLEKDLQDATKKAQEEKKAADQKAADEAKRAAEKAAQDALEAQKRQLQAAFDLKQLYAQRTADLLKETADNEQIDYRQRIVYLKLYTDQEKQIIEDRVQFEIKQNKLTGSQAKLAIEKGNSEKLALTNAYLKTETKLIKDEAEKRLKADEEAAKKEAEFLKTKDDELQAQADKEYDINLEKIRKINAINDANREAEKQKEQQLAEFKRQITLELVDFAANIVSGTFEKRKNEVQEQIDQIDKEKEAKIAAENATAQSAEQRAAKIASIEATAAAKKEALERQQRKIDQDRAKTEKAFSILRIAIDTVQKVFALKAQAAVLLGNPLTAAYAAVTLAQIPFVIGSGALAAALIAATPIPKYRTGRKGGPAEFAITGDGGVKEVIQYTDGTTQLTPDKPTLTYLPQGAKVYKSVTDYIKEYSSFTRIPDVAPGNVQINEMHAHQQTMQMMKMELNDMRNDLKSIEKAITAKPVHQINQTWSGVEVSFEGVAGWTKYTNRYLKT